MTTQTTDPENGASRQVPAVISYQTNRKIIGWLSISLPVVMILGSFAFGECKTIQPSVSLYYFTNMRDLLVGELVAVAAFLFSYKGFDEMDSIATNLAGFFCLGVAVLPTRLVNMPCEQDVISLFNISSGPVIHFVFAGLFFFTLALISIFLFTKSSHDKQHQTPEKRKRNVIYVVCGIVMIAAIIGIGVYLGPMKGNPEVPVVLCCETVALVAFGISWLTKGEAIFGDKIQEKV